MKIVRRCSVVLFVMATMPFSPVLAKDKEPVEVRDNGAMQGATQVAVVGFNVGFIFESVDQTKKTGGLMGAFGGTTKAQSSLIGVTPEMMQDITDAAYNDFIAKLAGSGITVASADYSGLSGDHGPSEERIELEKKSSGKAIFYAPTAVPMQVFLSGDVAAKKSLGNFGADGRASRNSQTVKQQAKDSGVPVVNVVYLIDFSDQKRPGAFSFGGSLQVNANLSIVPDYSKSTIFGPNGKQNRIEIAQPVTVEGEFIEVEDASTGGEKAVQSAANVAGGLAAAAEIGLPRFGKTRKFEFTANQDNYEAGAIALTAAANDLVVTEIARQN